MRRHAKGARKGRGAQVLASSVALATLLGGCSATRSPQAGPWQDPQGCRKAYARGDDAALVRHADQIDRLDEPCRRLVLRALASEDPERLLEVATDSGRRDWLVAAALAAGASGRRPAVPLRTARVLERSRDGRLLRLWLEQGALRTMDASWPAGQELVEARRDVARLLWLGADSRELREAVTHLAQRTERALQEPAMFDDGVVPKVPVHPVTESVTALGIKLSIVPYLRETRPEVAMSLLEGVAEETTRLAEVQR